MALVYEARRETQVGVSARVAIKVILPEHAESTTYKDLFVNEARIGAAMHHQNLVQILDFDAEENRYFLVMEYVEGLTVSRIISLAAKHDVRIPLSVICEIGRQACEGLHYAHEATDQDGRPLQMIHRDIKPSNLILTPEGAVKILDFGISKGRLRHERAGAVKGTWGYMSPEQATGRRLQPNADVFSVGIVLYELAARRAMFHRLPQGEIKKLLLDDHPARMVTTLDATYAPLLAVLDKALKRDPIERFATAAEFGRSLAELQPDPHTTRSELMELFRQVQDLHDAERMQRKPPRRVRPPRPGSSDPGGHAALPPRPGDADDEGPQAMILAGLVGVAVVVAAFVLGVGVVRALTVPDGGADVDAPGADVPAVTRPVPVERRPEESGDSDDGAAGGSAAAAEAESAWVQIRAQQPASVYVDGKRVQSADGRVQVEPGRHVVSIVAEDGRRTSTEVEVEAGEVLRRTWDFERLDWR